MSWCSKSGRRFRECASALDKPKRSHLSQRTGLSEPFIEFVHDGLVAIAQGLETDLRQERQVRAGVKPDA